MHKNVKYAYPGLLHSGKHRICDYYIVKGNGQTQTFCHWVGGGGFQLGSRVPTINVTLDPTYSPLNIHVHVAR